MNNMFLIPANSKKSGLLFGLFTTFDLILFAVGITLTIILLITLPVEQIMMAVIALVPALVCGFLVMPVPNYYNVRTFIATAISFYMNQRKFKWKGWCFPHGEEQDKIYK